jgi:HEXXH motif-containing protein
VQILEALIHESAHRQLFFLEAQGPLVNPHDRGLYPSPLKSDPRPLRAVLAAYHALVYMAAFNVELVQAKLQPGGEIERTLDHLRGQLLAAETTLLRHRRVLTSYGEECLDLIKQVRPI